MALAVDVVLPEVGNNHTQSNCPQRTNAGKGGRGGRGGPPRGGARGGQKAIVEPHRHAGIFVARGKEDMLVTKNLTPGDSVYGEKRIAVEAPAEGDAPAVKTEYRVWNPFRLVYLFRHGMNWF